MYIETDLQKIAQLAQQREDENWAFRSFLKASAMPSEELDAIVHELYEEVAAAIDCRACANCCRRITPTPTIEEIKRLAAALQISVETFKVQYLEQEGDHKGRLLRPCPLLQDNVCSVPTHRPLDCVDYPYLLREGFRTRLFGVLANYEICPIVFNVYEQLKGQLWRRRRRHARF
ncbi:MAG: YkgJ family cysteine cluster protein [Anaerolineae bacterium]|nr:YkgJ family cysteine cluster protein [Anaerolineae bacterium]